MSNLGEKPLYEINRRQGTVHYFSYERKKLSGMTKNRFSLRILL